MVIGNGKMFGHPVTNDILTKNNRGLTRPVPVFQSLVHTQSEWNEVALWCGVNGPQLPAAEGYSQATLSFGTEEVFFVTGEHPGAAFFL